MSAPRESFISKVFVLDKWADIVPPNPSLCPKAAGTPAQPLGPAFFLPIPVRALSAEQREGVRVGKSAAGRRSLFAKSNFAPRIYGANPDELIARLARLDVLNIPRGMAFVGARVRVEVRAHPCASPRHDVATGTALALVAVSVEKWGPLVEDEPFGASR